MSEITIRDLTKTFGNGVRAVDGLNLDIEDGAFVSLLGPSGCGKTTTLRIIAGLEQPETGSLRVGDRAFLDSRTGEYTPAEKRGLGMVFQSYALWPHMTVRENTEFALKLKGIGKSERAERVREVLGLLHIDGLEDRYSFQLSGGQQQRVALARMLASDADVFLLDEPLSNLDAKLRLEMRSELKRIHARFRRTTVFVTHDQIEAMTLSTHIAVMRDGAIQQFGSPEEIYHRPATRFVAEFVGSPPVNMVTTDQPELHGRILDALANTKTSNKLGEVAFIGFRPEHVRIPFQDSADGHRGPFVLFDAFVDAVLPTGPETIVQFTMSKQRFFARVGGETKLTESDSYQAAIDLDRLLLFDEQGEACMLSL